MNMKFDKSDNDEDEFNALFEFDSYEAKINHKAHMISFRFLSEVEKMIGGSFSKKAVSKLLGTSPSYVTQLFRGDKLINLITLAKLEVALNSEFDIVLRETLEEKKTEVRAPIEVTKYLQYKGHEHVTDYLKNDSTIPFMPNTPFLKEANYELENNHIKRTLIHQIEFQEAYGK